MSLRGENYVPEHFSQFDVTNIDILTACSLQTLWVY